MESLHMWTSVVFETGLLLLTTVGVVGMCAKPPQKLTVESKLSLLEKGPTTTLTEKTATSKSVAEKSGPKSKKELVEGGKEKENMVKAEPEPKKPAKSANEEKKPTDGLQSAKSGKADAGKSREPAVAVTTATAPTQAAESVEAAAKTSSKPMPTAKIGAMPEDGRPKIEKTVVLSLRHTVHDTGMNVGTSDTSKEESKKVSKKISKKVSKKEKEKSLLLDRTSTTSIVKEREELTQSQKLSSKTEASEKEKDKEKEQEVDATE